MLRFIAAVLIALFPAIAPAQTLQMLGSGSVAKVTASGSTFSGVGDIVGGWTFWGSCARVYSNAKASTSTSMCDLVAVTGGAAVCTLRGTTSGFVDLTAYCPGSLTPSAACAAASGGACRLAKLYDQSGSGNDMSNATLANMPDIDFSPGIGTGPGFSCVGRSGGSCTVATTGGTFTRSQPINFEAVYKSAANSGGPGGITGVDNSGNTFMGPATSVDQAVIFGGSSLLVVAATNTLWHMLQGTLNATCVLRPDSASDSTGACGSSTFSGAQLRCHRADGGSNQDAANMLECGILADNTTALSSQNRTDLNTNAHSAANGYNF